jgi:hypothetical protein
MAHTLFAWCTENDLKLAGTNWQMYGERSDDAAKQETLLYALLA